MRALSIRQPHAELILRGVKTIEYRSRPTRLIGERFYIYASKQNGADPSMAQEIVRELPRGVIVGTAVISECRQHHSGGGRASGGGGSHYEWHLSNVTRLNKPRKPRRMPQPVWFRPF